MKQLFIALCIYGSLQAAAEMKEMILPSITQTEVGELLGDCNPPLAKIFQMTHKDNLTPRSRGWAGVITGSKQLITDIQKIEPVAKQEEQVHAFAAPNLESHEIMVRSASQDAYHGIILNEILNRLKTAIPALSVVAASDPVTELITLEPDQEQEVRIHLAAYALALKKYKESDPEAFGDSYPNTVKTTPRTYPARAVKSGCCQTL